MLGATGTIGELTLEVAARHPQELRVIGLGAGGRAERLAQLAERFRPEALAVASEPAAEALRHAGWRGKILAGETAASELAAWPGAEIVLNGIVGASGLRPSLAALEAGRRLALANKESLVMAGALLRAAAARGGAEILPVDSEHSAIFQCLAGRDPSSLRRIVLTASGGPLRGLAPEALARVTPEQALRHPTWRMGPRITIDSATMFNKGLELIEARWLFDLPLERIAVWVHPQAIVHGLIELADGTLLAQLSQPDMRLPIRYALSHPERWDAPGPSCDLTAAGALEFAAPEPERFPCLALAQEAARCGGVAPAVANAADEVLVAAFLAGRITFPEIAVGLSRALADHAPVAEPDLAAILAADAWARRAAEEFADARGARA